MNVFQNQYRGKVIEQQDGFHSVRGFVDTIGYTKWIALTEIVFQKIDDQPIIKSSVCLSLFIDQIDCRTCHELIYNIDKCDPFLSELNLFCIAGCPIPVCVVLQDTHEISSELCQQLPNIPNIVLLNIFWDSLPPGFNFNLAYKTK